MQAHAKARQPRRARNRVGGRRRRDHEARRAQDAVAARRLDRFVDLFAEAEIVGGDDELLHRRLHQHVRRLHSRCIRGYSMANPIRESANAMTTLVTGATGFVGSAVVRQLLERGDVVRVLARPGGDRRNIADLPVEVAEGDLRDPAAARRALAGISDLFHVAADYRLWVRDSSAMYATNVEATVSLMRSAADAGVSRIVYTSSVATLGVWPDHTPADEMTPASLDEMVGPYKRSKYLAEEAVRELAESDGLP